MNERSVIFIIAHQGYQPIEYTVPKKILENAGYQVLTASNNPGTATAADNTTTPVDITLEAITQTETEGIFFIGGPGAMEHLDNLTSYQIAEHAIEKGIPLGAICVSPRILAKAGVLKNRKASGWDGDGELKTIFNEHEVTFVPKNVVADGLIITATGPEVAREFGEQILSILQEQKGWG